jgi:hypothetical protein
VLPAACSNCSPLLARTRGPARDPLLPVHAKPTCGPLLRRPVPSRPLTLAAHALSPSIPAAINGEAPVLPVTPPRRPSPSLFLSAYKSDPKPPLTPPTPPKHLSLSTSRCSSPPLLTIAAHHPSPWTALCRPSPHEVRAGIGPPRPPLYFFPLPGCCHAPGGRRPWPGSPPPTIPLPLLFCLEEEERQTCA